MKILSLNTWNEQDPWSERQCLMLAGIQNLKPDIISLQEIVSLDWLEPLKEKLDLKESVFPDQKSGLAILSKYPVKETGMKEYSVKAATEEFTRLAMFAALEAPKGLLYVFNTHLSWRPEDGAVRETQAKEIVAYAKERSQGRSYLMTGDFNAHDDKPEIQLIANAEGVVDTYREKNPDAKGFTWSHSNHHAARHPELPERRLDYIFASDGGEMLGPLKSSEIVLHIPDHNQVFPTDHFGVMTVYGD